MRERKRTLQYHCRRRVIDHAARSGDPPWLAVHLADHGTVVMRVAGGIDAERAELLWDAIEYVLADRPGCRVIVDLRGVDGFDESSVRELAMSAKTAVRRHDDLRVVVDPRGLFGYYLSAIFRTLHWPIYHNIAQADE